MGEIVFLALFSFSFENKYTPYLIKIIPFNVCYTKVDYHSIYYEPEFSISFPPVFYSALALKGTYKIKDTTYIPCINSFKVRAGLNTSILNKPYYGIKIQGTYSYPINYFFASYDSLMLHYNTYSLSLMNSILINKFSLKFEGEYKSSKTDTISFNISIGYSSYINSGLLSGVNLIDFKPSAYSGIYFNINSLSKKRILTGLYFEYYFNEKMILLSSHIGFGYVYNDTLKKYTKIILRVLNGTDGKGIKANLYVPELNKTYSIDKIDTILIKPGIYRLRAEKTGFKWQEKGVVLKKGDIKHVEFVLIPFKEQSFIAGKVFNNDHSTLENATVKILVNNKEIKEVETDKFGIFKSIINPGTYILIAEKEGYFPDTFNIIINDSKNLEHNFFLKPEEENMSTNKRTVSQDSLIKIVVKNDNQQYIYAGDIVFIQGKATLTKKAKENLDKLSVYLKKHEEIKIEVQGHTDSVGNKLKNLKLSQKRAQSVMNYLIMKGISPERLTAKGYGEKYPIADNRSLSGRRKNRRIEFLIK